MNLSNLGNVAGGGYASQKISGGGRSKAKEKGK